MNNPLLIVVDNEESAKNRVDNIYDFASDYQKEKYTRPML